MHFLGEGRTELVVMRNGAKGSNTTTYLIYPASAPAASSQPNKQQYDEPTEEEAEQAQRDYEASRRT
jgi:hypothetical protein